MTPSVLFLLSVSGQVPLRPLVGPWPLAMAETKMAKQSDFVRRLSAAMLPRPSSNSLDYPKPAPPSVAVLVVHQGPRSTHVGGIPYSQAAAIEAGRLNAEVESDAKMGLSGQPEIARRRLEAELLKNPSEQVAVPLMDVEMASGDFASAYKVAVPFVRRGNATTQFLLRASLAAAKCGEVYEGQRDFLVKHLVDIYAPSEIRVWLPSGESAEVVATLSAYSVAAELGTRRRDGRALPFYEMARSSDPTNPLFCSGAAASLAELNRYSEAIKVLASAYGRARDWLHDEIRGSIWYYRRDLKEVGDGHPYPPPVATVPTAIKP